MPNKIRNKMDGVSLVEVMISVAILVVVLTGLFQLFIYCSNLANISRNKTLALAAAQDEIEEIRNHTYSLLTIDYIAGGSHGNTFDLTQPPGKGVIYLDNTNPDLIKINVSVSWRNQDGRVVGEDQDLDAVLDAGEDTNGNGQLDSPATIETLIPAI